MIVSSLGHCPRLDQHFMLHSILTSLCGHRVGLTVPISFFETFLKSTSYFFNFFNLFVDYPSVNLYVVVTSYFLFRGALSSQSIHEATGYRGDDDHAHKQGRGHAHNQGDEEQVGRCRNRERREEREEIERRERRGMS